MDKIDSIFVALVILITLLNVKDIVFDQLDHKETMDKLDVIEQRIEERTYLDSLYWEHLEECAFVSREDIKTDSRGYLYSQYLKKYGTAR